MATPDIAAPKSRNKTEIPMQAAKSVDGIISSLIKRHGGSLHEMGIVTITAKSIDAREFAVSNVADLTFDSSFCSKDEPGQWACWDFREMRVRPTHYTILAGALRSWVLEGSPDGRSWTEFDRRTDNPDFKNDCNTASFAVSHPAEVRFIRLTQTGRNYCGGDSLGLYAVEFFGTLYE